jgi:hypothetical protein
MQIELKRGQNLASTFMVEDEISLSIFSFAFRGTLGEKGSHTSFVILRGFVDLPVVSRAEFLYKSIASATSRDARRRAQHARMHRER